MDQNVKLGPKWSEIWDEIFYICSSVRPVVRTKIIQPFW